MTGINIAIKLSIVIFVIVTSAITLCSSVISDRRLCFDPKCSVPVAEAFTLMDYYSNDPEIMSFKSNTPVKVYSKSAGKRKDLWGVEINGERGYVPIKMIQEKKVLRKSLLHEVPTELIANKKKTIKVDTPKDGDKVDVGIGKDPEKVDTIRTEETVKETLSKTIPDPSHITPSFEIHDGTTIPLSVNEEPREPSYSTRTVPNSDGGEQHPVLSVHPNIGSTITFREGEKEASSDNENIEAGIEDAAPKLEGVRKENVKDDIVEKASEEKIPNVSVEPDVSPINETNIDDSLSNDDSKRKVEGNSVSVESSSGTNISSSPVEHLENTTIKEEESFLDKSDKSEPLASDASITEEVVRVDKTIDALVEKPSIETTVTEVPVKHTEEKTIEIPVEYQETKTTEVPLENEEEQSTEVTLERQEDEKTDKPLEKSLPEEKKPAKSPEIGEQSGILATPENNTTVEELGINDSKSVQKEEDIVKDSENLVVDNKQEESQINDVEVVKPSANVSESSPIDVENVEKEIKEPENVDSTPNSPLSSEEIISVEDSTEEKSTEEVPLNLNIMNPLFNRLSMLPSMVKDVIDNTLLSNNNEDATSSQDVGEDKTMIENIDINETESETEKVLDNDIVKESVENSVDEIPLKSVTTEPEVVQESNEEKIVNTVDTNNNLDNEKNKNGSTADSTETSRDFVTENPVQPGIYKEDESSGFVQENVAVDDTSSFNGFPANRNLLNVGSSLQRENDNSRIESANTFQINNPSEFNKKINENEPVIESLSNADVPEDIAIATSDNLELKQDVIAQMADSCLVDSTCQKPEDPDENHSFISEVTDDSVEKEFDIMNIISIRRNYWETLTYLVITAFTTLLFSLGYYYIENTRRDGQYIAKINQLEKQLLVCSKECTVLDDTLKSTKTKLDSIEDESFGSNEMVASLKADLEASKIAKSELEDQVGMLEKELESATEAGLELERMLREILSTNNAENPLAQSVEDLQTRLNAQQAANEALTNALNLKAQENETLTTELKAMTIKSEQLEVEVTRITEELKHQKSLKSNLEQTLLGKVEHLEKQVKDITAERINLRKQLKGKEMEMKDLLEVVNQMNINNLDFEKLYNVSKVKAEASQLLEERDDLKIRLSEVEGAHQLLEEHVKLINEEVSSLSEQCKLAEKAKRDAETKVEVLSNFFKEKEAQRQKEEAVWLQKQGEVSSTVERLHTMQNEIHNYKQQIEMLKREILDQEREYKNQISSLETKAHENWVLARQNERRLEESKAEAGQLRNRLTMIEKNLNDTDPEAKLHRLETNGETATSPPLFIGAEASSSPIMFSGSSGVPLPPPPSYLYGPPVPPFLPPLPHSSSDIGAYEVGQRPPPVGGRLSSPPPLHSSNSGRYDNPRSPPPPLSPSMIPPYGPPHRGFRPPFPNERMHRPPPPPPHSTHLPPPLGNASSHNWGDETLPPPPLRNSGFQPHQQQTQHHHHHHHHRDNQQRARNHKGSLHSSGESLNKNL